MPRERALPGAILVRNPHANKQEAEILFDIYWTRLKNGGSPGACLCAYFYLITVRCDVREAKNMWTELRSSLYNAMLSTMGPYCFACEIVALGHFFSTRY